MTKWSASCRYHHKMLSSKHSSCWQHMETQSTLSSWMSWVIWIQTSCKMSRTLWQIANKISFSSTQTSTKPSTCTSTDCSNQSGTSTSHRNLKWQNWDVKRAISICFYQPEANCSASINLWVSGRTHSTYKGEPVKTRGWSLTRRLSSSCANLSRSSKILSKLQRSNPV